MSLSLVSLRETELRFSFGYQLHELLAGIVISDIQDLCRELDKRLQHEIRVTLDHLFTAKIPELARVFEEKRAGQLSFRVEFPFAR